MNKNWMGICLALTVVCAALAFAQVRPAGSVAGSAKPNKGVVWETRLLDLGAYAKNADLTYPHTYGGKTIAVLDDAQRAKYNKDQQALLDEGWEPFAAGVYNGQPYANMEYVWFRRPRPLAQSK